MAKMTVFHGSYTPVERPDYMDGSITREQFWALARYKYPTHQISFCTPEAFACLEFIAAEEV